MIVKKCTDLTMKHREYYCRNCKRYTDNVVKTGNYAHSPADVDCVTWVYCNLCRKLKREFRDYFETYPLWMQFTTLLVGFGMTIMMVWFLISLCLILLDHFQWLT